jgi:DNA-binding transcriptional LysR family regulator
MTLPFTLRQLEYFDAIASEGSLSAAAERCNVSATGLALALDELERNMAIQLVIRRKGKGVELTSAGSTLLRHAQQLLAGAESFADQAAQSTTGLRGRFVIGCFPTLAPFFLPAAMEFFGREHAELELAFVEGSAPELLELLFKGQVDVAILYSVDVSGQVELEPIREYRPYVIIARSHPLAKRRTISLSDLLDEPLIQIDMRPSRQNTEHIFASQGHNPPIRYMTTNYELARCMVGRGLGYSLLIQRPATLRTYDGHDIATLELADDLAPTTVGLVKPHGAPENAKYVALRDFLKSHATPVASQAPL